jgi:hypothetical protein
MSVQTVNQTQVSIPDYARPYVENLLGQSAGSIYDYAKNEAGEVEYDETGMPKIAGFKPYMQYQGDRTAQFSPLQQMSYDNAALMQTSPQLADATALAGQAGLGALNTQYTFDPYASKSFTDQGTASNYMSPYMQNVVDVQTQQARRQADINAQTQQAQAARSGSFGGARDYISRAQGNAELQRNLANIQATGSQNAFTQGQAQFNAEQGQRQNAAQLNAQQQQYGAGLGLQGLQTAMQGAQQLGNLGQTQFKQGMDLMGLQNQFGGQQQQQAQNILNTQYQDFLNFQNAPYKQLGFMSDMLRGLPLTQTAGTMYQSGPSTANQLLGAATSLGGAYLMGGRKEGGVVGNYANGGAVNSRPAGLAELALSRMA